MEKVRVFWMLVFMLMFANTVWSGESSIKNGSFEEPGFIITNILEIEPNDWDVNLPAGKFGGSVGDTYGVTDPKYSLTLWSNAYKRLLKDDIGYVYQYVSLRDVNEISFSVNLDTNTGVWDPNLRTAVVMIGEGEKQMIVWESNSVGPDVRNQYYDKVIINIEDFGEHRFAIGLRVDVNENENNTIKYYTDWDSIGCKLYCDGYGFLAGDFSRDCYVDFIDYAMLAFVWEQKVDPNSQFNLSREGDIDTHGIINFKDYAMLANTYDGNDFSDLNEFTGLWLSRVPVENEWNLFIGDFETHGVINFKDYAVLANVYDGNDLSALDEFTELWLSKVPVEDNLNLFRGDDVEACGVIDFSDLCVFVTDWLLSSYD